LKEVGDFGSMAAARFRDDLTLGPWDMALIWRDSRGFLGGLEASDMTTNCRVARPRGVEESERTSSRTTTDITTTANQNRKWRSMRIGEGGSGGYIQSVGRQGGTGGIHAIGRQTMLGLDKLMAHMKRLGVKGWPRLAVARGLVRAAPLRHI